MVHFSDILMVLKDRRFKNCERIYTIDFPCCQGNISAIVNLAFLFLVFLLLLEAFYFIRFDLIYQKLCSLKHQAPFCQIFFSFQ